MYLNTEYFLQMYLNTKYIDAFIYLSSNRLGLRLLFTTQNDHTFCFDFNLNSHSYSMQICT